MDWDWYSIHVDARPPADAPDLTDQPVAGLTVGRGIGDAIVAAGRRPADLGEGRKVALEGLSVEQRRHPCGFTLRIAT